MSKTHTLIFYDGPLAGKHIEHYPDPKPEQGEIWHVFEHTDKGIKYVYHMIQQTENTLCFSLCRKKTKNRRDIKLCQND